MCYRFQSYVLLAGLAFVLVIGGCASQQNAVVATVGGDKISLDEFNTVFTKSNGGKDTAQKATTEDREKFLDLYVQFKLKIKDAYDHGYQNDPGLQAELHEYTRNLAVTLLMEREINEPAIHRMYDDRLVEVRASHILLQLSPNAIPPDTAKAYMRAMQIIDSLKAGRSFEELALNNSQDPAVTYNKGDLNYFTSGKMVPEFEDAVFSAPAGAVLPYPVRTQYGYHIIKITDRQPNPGSIRVSHIIKRLTPQSTAQDTAKAVKALEAALDSLKHGAKFADLAKSLSDDQRLKDRGGDIGFIDRGRTVKSFEDVVFRLKAGETSGIIKTPYGLHIAQVTEVEPVASFASMEQELRSFFQQHGFQKKYDLYANALKKEYNFVQSAEAVSAWNSSIDTAKTTSSETWDSLFSTMTRAKELFTFAGQRITIDSVIRLTKAEQELGGLPFSNPATSGKIFDKISKNLVMEYKAQSVESTFPDFERTIKEYKEGSMLFKAEQNEVWNKISINDSAMHVYFDANRSKFMWPDRVNFQEIFVPNDSASKVVTFLLKKQKLPFDSVAAQYNKREATKQKNGEWGLMPATSNALSQRAWTMNVGEVSEFFPFQSWFSILKVLEKIPAGEKTFTEAGSELSSAFQEAESKRLENEWYESLLKKYPVTVYKEAVMISPEQTSKK